MITDKQKLERTESIGGSDVAAILGLSPWKTPGDVKGQRRLLARLKPDAQAKRSHVTLARNRWLVGPIGELARRGEMVPKVVHGIVPVPPQPAGLAIDIIPRCRHRHGPIGWRIRSDLFRREIQPPHPIFINACVHIRAQVIAHKRPRPRIANGIKDIPNQAHVHGRGPIIADMKPQHRDGNA